MTTRLRGVALGGRDSVDSGRFSCPCGFPFVCESSSVPDGRAGAR